MVVAGNLTLVQEVGGGPPWGENIPAIEAKVVHPHDVDVDSIGNLYIAGETMHDGASGHACLLQDTCNTVLQNL
jgi:hypothetical protein